ncbi:aspergillopepsin [Cylindrobasidium torrendii FP15055 ss-10]|uniref:Aspergillopepsin n=1 Tax=Cylindrobasidium torrendii FP15055 ss-10 TaxID=1314674 RepID=A0A0D7BR28_9AGAR|nr:aspergillopepsin [Cylindrobasidium torrendii FP15055 ss-10]
MFNLSFATALLLASAALAIPTSDERRELRIARRREQRGSQPPIVVDAPDAIVASSNETAHVSYSSNWSGAVLVANTATYKSVTGTFTVPTPSKGTTSSSTQAASAWVGIDGDTCSTAILQTGIDFYVEGSGVSFDAWYEFYPDYAYDFSGVTVSAGDSITLTATVSSATAGTVVITNNSKGWTKSKSLTSSARLCQYNAEWIVEDFSVNSGLIPFADFGTVTFTGASATTNSGSSVGPGGSEIIEIQQSSKVLTSTDVSGSTVSVTYIG